MTMSSHPGIKFLTALISAIAVGVVLHSWVWSVVTFFGLMFIFIFLASWIFGGSIKGKVELNDELEGLLDKLETIGNVKNELPFSARGWCNSLGLFVQLKEAAGLKRLQAGEKYKSHIDAWQDYVQGQKWLVRWKVKKYDKGDWEKLVEPTLDMANWLSTYGGLPEEYMDSFNTAIQLFKKEGHLELPNTKKPTVSKAEVLEEMWKLEDVVKIGLLPRAEELTYGEKNLIMRKVHSSLGLVGTKAFPVTDEANEAEIDKWLKDPRINSPLPDDFMMSAAAGTAVPVEIMERILRTLLKEKYDTYWVMAEEQIRSKKRG